MHFSQSNPPRCESSRSLRDWWIRGNEARLPAFRFCPCRADKEVLTAELGITHARCISRKVIRLGANLLDHFGIGGYEGTKRDYQLFDFALVEQATLVDLHPSFLVGVVIGMQPARQLPQVLAGMIQIDNLHRARKVLLGKIPDPFGSIAHDHLLFRAAPAAL